MRKRNAWIFIGCAVLSGADWLTDGGNPQRTGWQKDEKILNKDNVKGMKALWTLKLDNEPRELHSLFPPLIAGGQYQPRPQADRRRVRHFRQCLRHRCRCRHAPLEE